MATTKQITAAKNALDQLLKGTWLDQDGLNHDEDGLCCSSDGRKIDKHQVALWRKHAQEALAALSDCNA